MYYKRNNFSRIKFHGWSIFQNFARIMFYEELIYTPFKIIKKIQEIKNVKDHRYHCFLLFIFYFHFLGILSGCNFANEKFCDILRKRLKSANLRNIIHAKITQLYGFLIKMVKYSYLTLSGFTIVL